MANRNDDYPEVGSGKCIRCRHWQRFDQPSDRGECQQLCGLDHVTVEVEYSAHGGGEEYELIVSTGFDFGCLLFEAKRQTEDRSESLAGSDAEVR